MSSGQRKILMRSLLCCGWILVTGLVLTIFQFSAQANRCPGMMVRPEDDLRTLSATQPEGAIFCLRPGIYKQVSVVPKDYQAFIAQGSVIFDGENVTGIAFNGVIDNRHAAANREGVQIRGITFIHYRTSNPLTQAVLVPDAGWQIEKVVIRDSTSGIRGGNVNWSCANNFVLRDVLLENISHAALYWNAAYGLTERLVVRDSGYQLTRQEADWNGVVKYQNQGVVATGQACPTETKKQLIVQDSLFENLNGIGWWCDIHCRDVMFRRNTVKNNYWGGVMFEISGGGHTGAASNVFEANVFSCNRTGDQRDGVWGAGEFFISNSNSIIIRNNEITVCENGRAFAMADEVERGSSTYDILIENNRIYVQGVPTYTALDSPIKNVIIATQFDGNRSARNIRFRHNQYFVKSPAEDYFAWGGSYDWEMWRRLMADSSTFSDLSSVPLVTTMPTG